MVKSRTRASAVTTLAALLLVACNGGPDSGSDDASGSAGVSAAIDGMAPMPEAVSLFGNRLYPLEMDSATAAHRYARLDSAMAVYEAHPDSAEALIWLGRHYGYAGLYRDAIDAFTEGIGRFPDDARFYRHRGHRYISVREFDRAIEDLEHAARLTSGAEDRVEPDGLPNDAGIPRSTLQTNIWYHLGLAHYLKHDFEAAAHAFRRGYELSPNDDMRVAMADWLWLSLKRLDQDAEARRLLAEISDRMEVLENDAYLDRLLVYKGERAPETLLGDPAEADPLQLATHGYGLGAWHLVRGDEVRAREIFKRVMETGYWPAFGYIAAEAELVAMDQIAAPPPAPTSRPLNTPAPEPVDTM